MHTTFSIFSKVYRYTQNDVHYNIYYIYSEYKVKYVQYWYGKQRSVQIFKEVALCTNVQNIQKLFETDGIKMRNCVRMCNAKIKSDAKREEVSVQMLLQYIICALQYVCGV